MLTVSLFLGYPVGASYAKAMEGLNPKLLDLYVSNHPESYLQEILFEGVKYLGKFAGNHLMLAELVLLEKNIYSILNKMIPGYPYDDSRLVLFPVPSTDPLTR